jgi:uncharacterized protein YukE
VSNPWPIVSIGHNCEGANLMLNFLFRFARKVVEGVLSQLTQQLNVVQELAMAPMRAMIQQVVGGVWRGEGANAFVQEVSTLMIPGVGRVAETITGLSRNLQHAQSVIDRADEEVSKIVNSKILDVFKFF